MQAIAVPDSVAVQTGAFDGCSALTELILSERLQFISEKAFANCSALTELVLPERLQSISGKAFANCSGLTKLILPERLQSISEEAFVNCSSLLNISLPENLSSLGVSAFNGCTSLSNIYIGSNMAEIGEQAFQGCAAVKHIYCLGETPPVIYYNTFHNYRATLHVLVNTKATYEAADYWKNFTDIVEDASVSVDSVNDDMDICYVNGFLFLRGMNVPAAIAVYTMEGQCIYSSQIASDNDSCDLSMLVDGIYIVRIHTGNKIENIKILKQ